MRESEQPRIQLEFDDAGNDDTRVIEWIRECHSPVVNLMDDGATKITGMNFPGIFV